MSDDEQEKHAEIRIGLGTKALGIPYGPVKREDGENYGYMSLIKNPEAIDNIPELFGEPEMKAFVAGINSEGGDFESVRILHWSHEMPDGQTRKCINLGVIFRDRRLFSDYGSQLLFAGNVLQHMTYGNLDLDSPPLFDIQQARLIEERVSGWIIDVYLGGIGSDFDAANKSLAATFEKMLPMFRS